MRFLRYIGGLERMIIGEHGPVSPGDVIPVSDDAAESHLRRGDFEEVKEAPPAEETAPASSEATTEAPAATSDAPAADESIAVNTAPVDPAPTPDTESAQPEATT